MKKELTPKLCLVQKNSETIFDLKDSKEISIGRVKLNFSLSKTENGFSYSVILNNNGDEPFSPDSLSLSTGIDTYMISYPQWNDCYFPSFFRCEKTHFYGYFMSPTAKIIGVYSESPIACYSINYNGGGHRIEDVNFSLIHSGNMPWHHPQNLNCIESGVSMEWHFNFCFCDTLDDFTEILADSGLPVIKSKSLVSTLGQSFDIQIACRDNCELEIISPDGKILDGNAPENYGCYSITAKSEKGKISTGFAYCRKPWEWYFKAARKEAITKPPKATTNCESWYGFYTMFLGAKHYPDSKLDMTAEEMFSEIMPYMFDMDNAEPIIITERLQNVSTLIGVLTDRYQADPVKGREGLVVASRFADWLVTRQGVDGAYYRDGIHYTCVIYPAKSMLELAEVEASIDEPYFREAAKRHYDSAKRAVDNLVELLEAIGTEGEHTLEDGMITCSALQIAAFALTLPENKREKYITAAEHMLKVHSCLEQPYTPDCRVRGTTIRYWEAQYDVEIKHNFVTGPHGWTAWLLYALYYLYLLTGKEEYLERLYSGMSACVQLVSIKGELRWAFAVDPYIQVEKRIVPDLSFPVEDGYSSVKLNTTAFKGKFVSDTLGEEYIDMISGWYRISTQNKVTGGFLGCPLFLKDKTLHIENQGGCCDNDVHEIFKCLEETLLNKAFLLEREDGTLMGYGCSVNVTDGKTVVEFYEEVKALHTNIKSPITIAVNGKEFALTGGKSFIAL